MLSLESFKTFDDFDLFKSFDVENCVYQLDAFDDNNFCFPGRDDDNNNNDDCLTCGALECLSFSFAEDTIVSSFYSKAGCLSDNDHQNHRDEYFSPKLIFLHIP